MSRINLVLQTVTTILCNLSRDLNDVYACVHFKYRLKYSLQFHKKAEGKNTLFRMFFFSLLSSLYNNELRDPN